MVTLQPARVEGDRMVMPFLLENTALEESIIIPFSTPSGYRVLGIGEFESITSNLRVYNAWINGNYVNAYIRNMAVNTDYKDQMIAVQLYFIRNI